MLAQPQQIRESCKYQPKANVAGFSTKEEIEAVEQKMQSNGIEQDLLEQLMLPDLPMKRALECDPRQISNLNEEQRLAIRKDHPEMSQYFFMGQRDKTKYFHTVNHTYSKMIKLSEPPGSAPKKKSIRFKTRFEVRVFDEEEECDRFLSRRSYMELYRADKKKRLKARVRFDKFN